MPTEPTPYRIPEAVRRWVLARDRTCSHPGCERPSVHCDLDHAKEWPLGPTCPCNLTPRCRRHHNAKTHHRWRVEARLDGSHVTVSPTGRAYPTAADPPPGALRGLTPHSVETDVDSPVAPGMGTVEPDADPSIDSDDPVVVRLITQVLAEADAA